jgi:hypothetical protein
MEKDNEAKIQVHYKKQDWTFKDLPQGKVFVTTKWVYKTKMGVDGSI